MGKGFNNYMCKKFFHPASRDNLKRVWMAEQQTAAEKQKQEDLRAQYEKEQDLHDNKALLSKDSKDKLSVNFMYEPPPGVRKERDDNDHNPSGQPAEPKFEWQRQYNAPRESYCKGDTEIRDQPFGIQVRNVRCIKCHKWGHINTDKECTMYHVSMSEARKLHAEAEAVQLLSKGELEQQMADDGLAMKRGALELQHFQQPGRLHQLLPEGETTTTTTTTSSGQQFGEGSSAASGAAQPESEFLRALSTKQKRKLLRKLQKIEKLKRREARKMSERTADKKRSKKRKRKHSASSSESESASSSSSSSSSSSESSSSDSESKRHKHRSKKSHKKSHDKAATKRHDKDTSTTHRRRHDGDERRKADKVERRRRSRSRSPQKTKSRRDRSTSRDRKTERSSRR